MEVGLLAWSDVCGEERGEEEEGFFGGVLRLGFGPVDAEVLATRP